MYENHVIYLAMNMRIITTQEGIIVCFDLKKGGYINMSLTT